MEEREDHKIWRGLSTPGAIRVTAGASTNELLNLWGGVGEGSQGRRGAGRLGTGGPSESECLCKDWR